MKMEYEWGVVGAGPAGIAAIGKLLDSGVQAKEIAWIDPEFKAGDLGTVWQRVISNTRVEAFMKYYNGSAAFQFGSHKTPFFIERIPIEYTCPLNIASQPLHWITQHLGHRVQTFFGKVSHLRLKKINWELILTSSVILHVKKVILAIGCEPKELSFSSLHSIPLAIALNPQLLRQAVNDKDVVVLFGSAQSASSILKNLEKIKAKKIFHFYRSISSFDRHLDDLDLSHVHSLLMTPENLLRVIPDCNKVIYALGFQRRSILIEGLPLEFNYDYKTGIIAPGIFGIGFAFPEIRLHEMGRAEYQVVGVYSFMKRLQRLLPVWMSQDIFSFENRKELI